jgi:hypothetical protein
MFTEMSVINDLEYSEEEENDESSQASKRANSHNNNQCGFIGSWTTGAVACTIVSLGSCQPIKGN